MKKVWPLVVSILLIFTLCACAGNNEPYTVEMNRLTFEINPEVKTIFDGTDTYTYTISGTDSGYHLTITYPDGSTYSEASSDGIVTISASKDYNQYHYMDGSILCKALEDEISAKHSLGHPFLGLLVILLGLFPLLAPRAAWYWEWGWRFQNAEPSNLALICNRISGAVCIIFGILLVFLI